MCIRDSNVVATNKMYGIIAGSNTINASTISAITTNSNVVADNVVTTNKMYGTIAGANTVSASTIYVGTGTPSLGNYELRVDGDTEITGNLLVGGTTTAVDTENLVVKDPIIQLGDATTSVDSGLLLARPTNTDNVYIGYDQSRTEFAIGFTDNHAENSIITVKENEDFTLNVYGNVEASYFFGDGTKLIGVALETELDNVESDVTDLTSNVNRVKNNLTSNSGRIGVLESNVVDLTSNLSSNAERIGVLESNVVDLTSVN